MRSLEIKVISNSTYHGSVISRTRRGFLQWANVFTHQNYLVTPINVRIALNKKCK